jgi:hypothetical protein
MYLFITSFSEGFQRIIFDVYFHSGDFIVDDVTPARGKAAGGSGGGKQAKGKPPGVLKKQRPTTANKCPKGGDFGELSVIA